jgi:hypothetical protein
MKPKKYILSVDNKYWRVKVRIDTETKNKCFSFAKYNSKENALKEAVIWRDKILKQHNLLDRLDYKKSPNFFQHYGDHPVIGISLTYVIENNRYRYNWTARYQQDNKIVKKSFSVNKYGTKKAFLKACEFRFQHCGKLRIKNRKYMPCEIPEKLCKSE